MPPGKAIYTVGHSNLPWEEFVRLLAGFGIEIVADVRRFPTSKKHPHFTREALARGLSQAGIRYEWLGAELGGYRRGGYEAHMRSESFRQGIARLLSLSDEGRVAILCAERDPRGCHRRYISSYLASLGVRVVHILGLNEAYTEITPLRFERPGNSERFSGEAPT